MGIRHPLISEIAKDTYLFNEFGLCNHYLLVGTERALLIDCGMGYYDLRATVERMTDTQRIPLEQSAPRGRLVRLGGHGGHDQPRKPGYAGSAA